MVEIVVAIGVLAVGVVGVSYFFAGSTRITRSASNTSVASNLGQGVLDEKTVKSYNDPELNPGDGSETEFSNDSASPFYNFSKRVNISCVDINLLATDCTVIPSPMKKIDVIIYWNEGNSEKNLQFSTIKAKE